jgi:Pro-kumamolisin, activation domain/Bacterial Ig-like domain (group 3)
MRSRLVSSLLLSAATLFTPVTQAAVQNRVTSGATGGSRVALPGMVNGHAKRSVDLGLAASDRKLESLMLRFSMTDAQQADLNQLLAAQLDPSSPSYHQWLTPEQFGARFGLSSDDIAKVSAWLTSQGLTITEISRSSTYISFSGTVGQVEQAFGTSIHSLSLNGEQHISNLTDPTLPSGIAGVVGSVLGLDDFKLKSRVRRQAVTLDPAKPLFTQTTSGVTSHYISPADLYKIYDFPTSVTGTGITIAVMGQTQLIPAQVTAFRAAAGFASTTGPTQTLVGLSNPGVSSSDIDEAQLDVEWSGAAAPGATIAYYYASPNSGGLTGGVFAALNYAISNRVAPIITISYGLCEAGWGTSVLGNQNVLLAQANAQGQTVFSAAGDAGATDCDVSGISTEGLGVDFPASSPYVTAAGGTQFSGDVGSPGTYWSTTNGTNGLSALSYIPEAPWNETTASGGLDAGGAAGGGASAYFAKPAWQSGSGVPNDSSRDLPDVSLNAAAMHDGYLVCSQNASEGEAGCANNTFLTTTNVANVFGGTSFVAPSLAGVLALVEQKLGVGTSAATGLGNIGPTLYGIAKVANVYHDITSGSNSVPCTQGTLNCNSGGSIGFNAGVGYDQATGLGTIDVANLVNNWSSAVPTSSSAVGGCNQAPNSSTTGNCGTTTTSLTTSSAICAVSTGTLALSVTVNGSISGKTPTGTVQFLVDNVAVSGAIVTLPSGSGTATYTLTFPATLSSGGHTISAVYSGDSNYAGSKGTLLGPAVNSSIYPNGSIASVDIVSGKDFSITPCTGTATSVTVQSGATSSGITFTITPVGGFTGTVTLVATNNDGMAATTSFSPATVNLTSAAVTSSFVVKASQTSKLNRPDLFPHSHPPGSGPWYLAGSGATLACMLLLTFPRRRRWGALLAVLISVAALTAVGCGSSSSNSGGSGGSGGGGGSTTTNASSGTYTFTITAVSGTQVHSTQVTVTVP